MSLLRAAASRLVGVLRRRRLEADLAEELGTHLAMLEEDGVRAGMNREDARRSARLRLGGVEQTAEAVHDARGFPTLDQALQDLRYGVRTLARKPAFTAFAVLTLALGIGATTAVFSVVDAVLLRPLPGRESGQIVRVYEDVWREGELSSYGPSPDNLMDLRARARLFDGLAIFYWPAYNLVGREQTELVQGMAVTEDFFRVMRVRPLLGRAFAADEYPVAAEFRRGTVVRKTPPGAVILSYGLWQRAFGGSPSIVGRVVRLGLDDMSVVGVMPREFTLPAIFKPEHVQQEPDCWVPAAFLASEGRRFGWANGIGRVRDGVGLALAQAEMDALARQLAREYPVDNGGKTIRLAALQETVVGDVRPQMRVLAAAVTFVLLIACANVTNLLLVRAAGRRRELATRGALGAGRGRLIRQLLTETVLVALASCTVGLLLAHVGVAILVSWAPATLPRLGEIAVDAAAFLFSVALSLVAGVSCGVAPALRATRSDITEALKDEGPSTFGPRRRWLSNMLVVTETALALGLLIGTGLLARTFLVLQGVDPGIRADRVITVGFNQAPRMFNLQAGRVFYRDLLQRVAAIPGVEVAAVGGVPISVDVGTGLTVEGRPGIVRCTANTVSEQYFQTVGVRLVTGRYLVATDDAGSAPVAVVSRSLAAQLWPGTTAVGRRVAFGDPARSAVPWTTVVGVVEDTRNDGLEKTPRPMVYKPLWQDKTFDPNNLLVRSAGDPKTLLPALRAVVRSLDKDRALARVATLDDRLSALMAPRRFNLFVIGIFSVVAFLLAVVGVYAVVAHTVAIRTREIGTRMMLGADRGAILRLIVRQNAWLIFTGVGIGIALALAANRAMTTMVFGVTTTDATTYAAIAGVWTVVALAACVVPASRAMRIDPIAALRRE
jgi:putative ABC transport system permease protein